MKVFISWSGPISKRLAEAIRDWLPSVIQLVAPYFTPSDIEKGNRWATDIAKELEESQIGIICVTRDNLHSDWILFEAGALSKSLSKGHVCPILFGITNTDLAGPLKQFQTTEFEKSEFHKLLSVINNRLGDHKLPPKTLDNVFEKWWPDLQEKIDEILATVDKPALPIRSDRELLEEILQLGRANSKVTLARSTIASEAIQDLLTYFVELHDQQANQEGSYLEALEILKKMRRVIDYVSTKSVGDSEELVELKEKFKLLPYTLRQGKEEDEDIPF